jgi:hypothetical protein
MRPSRFNSPAGGYRLSLGEEGVAIVLLPGLVSAPFVSLWVPSVYEVLYIIALGVVAREGRTPAIRSA